MDMVIFVTQYVAYVCSSHLAAFTDVGIVCQKNIIICEYFGVSCCWVLRGIFNTASVGFPEDKGKCTSQGLYLRNLRCEFPFEEDFDTVNLCWTFYYAMSDTNQ